MLIILCSAAVWTLCLSLYAVCISVDSIIHENLVIIDDIITDLVNIISLFIVKAAFVLGHGDNLALVISLERKQRLSDVFNQVLSGLVLACHHRGCIHTTLHLIGSLIGLLNTKGLLRSEIRWWKATGQGACTSCRGYRNQRRSGQL